MHPHEYHRSAGWVSQKSLEAAVGGSVITGLPFLFIRRVRDHTEQKAQEDRVAAANELTQTLKPDEPNG